MKIVTTFYRRMYLIVYPLRKDTLRPVPARVPVEIGALTDGDLAAYLRFRPDQDPREIRSRLERGDRCFVCRLGGEIVDAGWVATRRRVYVPYLRHDLLLEHGDVYYYDAFTLPAFRGQGLYMARNAYIGLCYQAEGYVRSVALVAVENRASHMVLRRAGLTSNGVYACLRFGPWQIHWQRAEAGASLLPLSSRA